jgi:cytochrome c-type biogenesis protein CcmH/NrfF
VSDSVLQIPEAQIRVRGVADFKAFWGTNNVYRDSSRSEAGGRMKKMMFKAAIPILTGLLLVAPALAQSTGPSHAGYDPNAPLDGHYHDGELGDKLLGLESELKCNCGCGLDLHSCQFQMQCGVSPAWSKRIRDALESGETVEVIEAGFVADFGKTVLLAPPPEGFNLVGYFLPVVAIVAAGILLGLLVRGGTVSRGYVPVSEPSDEEVARLREELRKLDEAESPDW